MSVMQAWNQLLKRLKATNLVAFINVMQSPTCTKKQQEKGTHYNKQEQNVVNQKYI